MLRAPFDGIMPPTWVAAFVLALLGLVVGLGALFWPRVYWLGWPVRLAARLLILLVAAIFVTDGVAAASQPDGLSLPFECAVGLVMIVVTGLHWVLSGSARRDGGRLTAGLIGLGLATAGWLAIRFIEANEPSAMGIPPSLGSLVEVENAHAYTDRGTPIHLYSRIGARPDADDRPPSPTERRVMNRAIQVGPADARSICHGWTFCDGRYILTVQSVELILKENGYREVDEPQAGDLIIYRATADGLVVHSGVVKAVADDGFVLVESKWAHHGRYLHEPKEQPYSNCFTYYRSERKGHLLLGLTAGPPAPDAERSVSR